MTRFLHPLETQDREQREADKDMVSLAVFKKAGGVGSLASVLQILSLEKGRVSRPGGRSV